MKSLVESIFDKDNITKDPFDSAIERLDAKKYGLDEAIAAFEQLFKMSKNKHDFYSTPDSTQYDKFVKELMKGDYVMLLHHGSRNTIYCAFAWIDGRRKTSFVTYHLNKDTASRFARGVNCFRKDVDWDFNWQLIGETGVKQLIQRAKNLGWDECKLITDKKQIESIKNRLYEIAN